jgi:hypothetical protein
VLSQAYEQWQCVVATAELHPPADTAVVAPLAAHRQNCVVAAGAVAAPAGPIFCAGPDSPWPPAGTDAPVRTSEISLLINTFVSFSISAKKCTKRSGGFVRHEPKDKKSDLRKSSVRVGVMSTSQHGPVSVHTLSITSATKKLWRFSEKRGLVFDLPLSL